MKKQIMPTNKKKWTLEDIRIQEEAIQSTFSWWQKIMEEKSSKLEKLCESEDNNFEQIEALRAEISAMELRGEREQKILDNFEKDKAKFLMSNFISGALNIKWN